MTEQNYGDFIVKIIETLKKNGYPQNQVSLPLEKMYESAHNRGINFNKVLEFLADKEGIEHRKTDEKIVFFAKAEEVSPTGDFDFAEFAKQMGPMDASNPQGFFAKAQEMLKNLPPEQLQKMMEMFNNLPDDKKEEIIKKGKDMGFTP